MTKDLRAVLDIDADKTGINTRLLSRVILCDADTAVLIREATNEIDRLRRKCDDLVSCLNGISRQTAEMVKANRE